MDIGDDLVRPVGGPVRHADPDGGPVLHQHFGHLGLGADVHPGLAAGAGHGLGNGPHAADGMAPGALHAVHLAEHVVQQHIGRAGGVGAGKVADDGIEAQHRLDRVALEPLVQPFPGAAGEQVEEVALALDVQLVHLEGQLGGVDDVHQPALGAGGRGMQDVAEGGHDAVQALAVLHIGIGVLRAELRDLRPVRLGPATGEQVAAVLRGQEVRRLAQDAGQAVAGQLHLPDHVRGQEAHRVGGHGVAEAGVELLRHCRAADHLPTLQHQHLAAAAGEVIGADHAVVPAADDDGVIRGPGGGRRAGGHVGRPELGSQEG